MERWNRMWSAVWWMCYTRSTSTPACTRAQRKRWQKWSWDGEAIIKYPSKGMRLPMQMDSSPSCTGCPSVPWKTSSGTHRPLLHRLVTIVRSLRLLISVPQSEVCWAHFCFQSQGNRKVMCHYRSGCCLWKKKIAEGLRHWILGSGGNAPLSGSHGELPGRHKSCGLLDISSWDVLWVCFC